MKSFVISVTSSICLHCRAQNRTRRAGQPPRTFWHDSPSANDRIHHGPWLNHGQGKNKRAERKKKPARLPALICTICSSSCLATPLQGGQFISLEGRAARDIWRLSTGRFVQLLQKNIAKIKPYIAILA